MLRARKDLFILLPQQMSRNVQRILKECEQENYGSVQNIFKTPTKLIDNRTAGTIYMVIVLMPLPQQFRLSFFIA